MGPVFCLLYGLLFGVVCEPPLKDFSPVVDTDSGTFDIFNVTEPYSSHFVKDVMVLY